MATTWGHKRHHRELVGFLLQGKPKPATRGNWNLCLSSTKGLEHGLVRHSRTQLTHRVAAGNHECVCDTNTQALSPSWGARRW